MGFGFWKFFQGLSLKPKSSSGSSSSGDIEVLSADNKLRFHNGTTNSPIVTESHSHTLTNKTIDADLNTISNIENSEIKAGAGIDRSKLASGTADHVLINNGSGVMSSESTLSKSRGGSGQDNSSLTFPASGTLATLSGNEDFSNKTFDDTNVKFLNDSVNTNELFFDLTSSTAPGVTYNIKSHPSSTGIVNITLPATSQTLGSPTGTANKIAIFNGSGDLSTDTELHYDLTNNFLGIDQTSPKAYLHIGSGTTSGTVGLGALIFSNPHISNNIGIKSVVFGNGNTVSGSTSASFGSTNNATGTYSFTIGNSNTASADRSFASGFSTTASGQNSSSFGLNTVASNSQAIACGDQSQASGINSFAAGASSIASGSQSLAFGSSATASSSNSVSFGDTTLAQHSASAAIGLGSKTQNNYQTVVGKYNSLTSDDLFTVGNGTADLSRSSAFSVQSTGRVIFDQGSQVVKVRTIATGSSTSFDATTDYLVIIKSGSTTPYTVTLPDSPKKGTIAYVGRADAGGTVTINTSGTNKFADGVSTTYNLNTDWTGLFLTFDGSGQWF